MEEALNYLVIILAVWLLRWYIWNLVAVVCFLYAVSWFLSGFGLFVFIQCGNERFFSEYFMLSGLIGWIISVGLLFVSYKVTLYSDIDFFDWDIDLF